MTNTDQLAVNRGTPEMREAMRHQIVVNGLRTSDDLAVELDLPHTLVVRLLERFEAVGALQVMSEGNRADMFVITSSSLSARFQDLDVPLW
jgi:hypothetical protein